MLYIISCQTTYNDIPNGGNSKMAYKDMIASIIKSVGGADNIESATHCFTRLRLVLKDESKADMKALESIPKVMKVVKANGQTQIVIGNEVANVYKELIAEYPALGGGEKPAEVKKEKLSVQGVLNTIASIFTPTIPALAGAGVIKGILVLLTTLNMLPKDSGTYQILNAAADSIFYFMPLVLAYTSAKIFNCSIPISMAIGGSLLYPNLVTFMAEAETITFLGLPVIKTTYGSSVIPIILAVLVYSKLEKLLDKVIPTVMKAVVAPLISLVIMVPATLLVFGPFGNYTSEMVGAFFQTITKVSPLLAGAFFGGTYSLLVMLGMHRALVPIGINEVSQFGSTTLWAFTGPSNFSQAGAAFGSFVRLKNKEEKSIALSAGLTALFGITEPALYGVNLKYKKPMIGVIVGGAIGGAIAGVGGARAYAVAIPSILTLPTFFGEGFVAFLIAIAVAFGVAFAMTLVMGVDKSAQDAGSADTAALPADEGSAMVVSPADGEIVPLDQVKDETFASGVLGAGVGIIPKNGVVYAPADGTLTTIFPTGHALGIQTTGGADLLIHIGINTVQLNGKYFKTLVKQGDTVRKGQKLVEFDLMQIQAAGYDPTIMLIASDTEADQIRMAGSVPTQHGGDLFEIEA